MKNIFVYIDYLDNLALERIQEELNSGNNVYALVCDKSIRICKSNYCSSSVICKMCNSIINNKIKKLVNTRNLHVMRMHDLISDEDKSRADSVTFEFKNMQELKALDFHGVEVGYAAFSSYVSNTRNISPTFNVFFHSMINDLLRSEVLIICAIKKFLKEHDIDLFIIHNGRHSNLKPFYRIAEMQNIDYILTERQWAKDGWDLKNDFYNTTPHTAKGICDKMLCRWESATDNKESIARSFFENRRYGKFSGDKNYVKNQVENQLPQEFDTKKRNVVIFNSSEDEYYSINKEFDQSGLYPMQYIALKALFEHFKSNSNFHFYLRIHPNLSEVPYDSHMKLYELKYDNVTIIPPTSPISSYALMEACEKVITFISTMTVESSFWKNPVIALNRFYYSYMDIAHEPRNEEDFFQMVETKDLSCKYNENCLKIAYYYMTGNAQKLQYFPTRKMRYTFGPVIVEAFSQFKLFNSSILLAFVLKGLRIAGHIGIIGRYHKIAENTK